MSIKKQMSNIGNKDKNANKKSNKKHKQKSVNCSKTYRPKFYPRIHSVDDLSSKAKCIKFHRAHLSDFSRPTISISIFIVIFFYFLYVLPDANSKQLQFAP